MTFPWSAPSRPKSAPPKVPTNNSPDIGWSRSYLARLARVGIIEAGWRPIVSTFARPEKIGQERLAELDPKSPVIFTANHRSHADTPILLTSIPEPWRHKLVVAAAKDYFFNNPVAGSFFALTIGAIPIERTKIDRSSAALAQELIAKGWSLLIYPEGGRSPDGWGKSFQGGAAYLASRLQIPVVPMYLAGTRDVLPRGRFFPQVAKSCVIFGSPIENETNTRNLARKITESTDALADELTTDWWQARKRHHRKASPTTLGPNAAPWLRSWRLSTSGRNMGKKRTAKNPW